MPQFDVGHVDRVAELRRQVSSIRGLHVVGSGMGAYGLPDCVESAEEAAMRIELRPLDSGAASRARSFRIELPTNTWLCAPIRAAPSILRLSTWTTQN